MVYLDKNERFFLAARNKPNTINHNYVISMDPDNFETNSKFYVGKVKSNLIGTIFDIWDNGKKITKASNDKEVRISRGCLTYVNYILMQRK